MHYLIYLDNIYNTKDKTKDKTQRRIFMFTDFIDKASGTTMVKIASNDTSCGTAVSAMMEERTYEPHYFRKDMNQLNPFIGMDFAPTYSHRSMLSIPESTPATCKLPMPINIIFNNPATIVYWEDGTKTIVKIMDGDVYDEIIGVSMAYTKKMFGTNTNFKNMVKSFYPKPKVLPEPVKEIVKKKKPYKMNKIEQNLEKLVEILSVHYGQLDKEFEDSGIELIVTDMTDSGYTESKCIGCDNVAGEVITDEG